MSEGHNLWEDSGVEDEQDQKEEGEDVVEVESDVVNDDADGSLETPKNHNSVVKPVEDLDEVVEAYEKYEQVKSNLLNAQTDITQISGNNHINKSGWRKIAAAFNLSVGTVTYNRIVEDDVVKYTVIAKAVAPNGKTVTAMGMCGSNESNFMRKLVDHDAPREQAEKEAENSDTILLVDGWYRELKNPLEVNDHNILTTAETRAKNRAISDLVGGGEVSAEEMGKMKREQILEQ